VAGHSAALTVLGAPKTLVRHPGRSKRSAGVVDDSSPSLPLSGVVMLVAFLKPFQRFRMRSVQITWVQDGVSPTEVLLSWCGRFLQCADPVNGTRKNGKSHCVLGQWRTTTFFTPEFAKQRLRNRREQARDERTIRDAATGFGRAA